MHLSGSFLLLLGGHLLVQVVLGLKRKLHNTIITVLNCSPGLELTFSDAANTIPLQKRYEFYH